MYEKKERRYMQFYDEWLPIIESTNDAFGSDLAMKVVLWMLRHGLREDVTQEVENDADIHAKFVFKSVRAKIEQDREKYLNTCERRAVYGAMGGRTKRDNKRASQQEPAPAPRANLTITNQELIDFNEWLSKKLPRWSDRNDFDDEAFSYYVKEYGTIENFKSDLLSLYGGGYDQFPSLTAFMFRMKDHAHKK